MPKMPKSQRIANITVQDLKQAILDSIIDNTLHKKMRDYLENCDGKPVNQHFMNKLSEFMGITVTLRKQFGMSSFIWVANGKKVDFLIAHEIKNLRFDYQNFLRCNPGFFEILDERNQTRREVAEQTEFLQTALELAKQLFNAEEKLKELLETFGTPLYEAGYPVRQLLCLVDTDE